MQRNIHLTWIIRNRKNIRFLLLSCLLLLVSSFLLNFISAAEQGGGSPPTFSNYELELLISGIIITGSGIILTAIFDAFEHWREERSRMLEIIKDYSNQVKDLESKERTLTSKLDCEIYAHNYLDLMDQIAYLLNNRIIRKDLEEYFDNYFAYALALRDWMYEHVIKKVSEKEKNWPELIEWGTYTRKSEFEPFEQTDLPESMINYDNLSDEPTDKAQSLQLVREYGKELKELESKERDLQTPQDCEIYAINYLDLMDQIAFLYKKGSLPLDVSEYFDNNFAYALTILNWVNKYKIRVRQTEKEDYWSDLVKWCDEHKEKIEPFEAELLPESMINYDKLLKK